jgi:hypothetical protein
MLGESLPAFASPSAHLISPHPQPSPHAPQTRHSQSKLFPWTPARLEYSQPSGEHSYEEYTDIPRSPPRHTRPGPSRRMPSLRPPPSPTHHTRLHKPQGKTVPRSGKEARGLPEPGHIPLSLYGVFSLKEHTIQMPMKVGRVPGVCVSNVPARRRSRICATHARSAYSRAQKTDVPPGHLEEYSHGSRPIFPTAPKLLSIHPLDSRLLLLSHLPSFTVLHVTTREEETVQVRPRSASTQASRV